MPADSHDDDEVRRAVALSRLEALDKGGVTGGASGSGLQSDGVIVSLPEHQAEAAEHSWPWTHGAATTPPLAISDATMDAATRTGDDGGSAMTLLTPALSWCAMDAEATTGWIAVSIGTTMDATSAAGWIRADGGKGEWVEWNAGWSSHSDGGWATVTHTISSTVTEALTALSTLAIIVAAWGIWRVEGELGVLRTGWSAVRSGMSTRRPLTWRQLEAVACCLLLLLFGGRAEARVLPGGVSANSGLEGGRWLTTAIGIASIAWFPTVGAQPTLNEMGCNDLEESEISAEQWNGNGQNRPKWKRWKEQ